jgi:hypothetical protein
VSYVQLALLGLQIVKWFLDRATAAKQFAAGEEHQIVEHAKAVLGMTAEGKRLLEKVNALSDGDLDDLTDAIGSAGKS